MPTVCAMPIQDGKDYLRDSAASVIARALANLYDALDTPADPTVCAYEARMAVNRLFHPALREEALQRAAEAVADLRSGERGRPWASLSVREQRSAVQLAARAIGTYVSVMDGSAR